MTARVRIVVLNHNGGALTLDCLRRLADTDWPATALEFVLVDNASTDEVVARVRDELPQVRVVASPVNLGFAGGCNLALRDLAEVDHVALVNNDLLVEPHWLSPLVSTLDADPGLGAACPKILFASPMVDVTMRVAGTTRRGRGDRRELGVRLSGVRVDGDDRTALTRFVHGFWGPEHGSDDEPHYQWTTRDALLRVPVPFGAGAASCELRLSSDRPTDVEIVSGGATKSHTVGREPTWYPVRLDGEPGDVINNVGSELTAEWYGADRGYLERDHGQYDTPEDVVAWCGAAVLLRRSYLDDVGLFDERLFLYYEDLELSLRGGEQGWRYRYAPSSVVRHMHSATSVEGSALADYYNERNRLLVLARHAPQSDVARALLRHVLVTASYARRDIVSPLLRGDPPRTESMRRRLRALAGVVRLAPAMVSDRRPGSQGWRRSR
jgi:GT2 family glycosyltransferase